MTSQEKNKSRDSSNDDGELQLALYNSLVCVCMCVFVNSSTAFSPSGSSVYLRCFWNLCVWSVPFPWHSWLWQNGQPLGKVFNYSTWTAWDYPDQRLLGRTKQVIDRHLSRCPNLPCHSFVKWFGDIINALHGSMQISASLEVNLICSV